MADTVKLASLYGVELWPSLNSIFNTNGCHIRNLRPQITQKQYSNHIIAPILRCWSATLLSKLLGCTSASGEIRLSKVPPVGQTFRMVPFDT